MNKLRAWIRELFGMDNSFTRHAKLEIIEDNDNNKQEEKKMGTTGETGTTFRALRHKELLKCLCDGDVAYMGKQFTSAMYSFVLRRIKKLISENGKFRSGVIRYFCITIDNVKESR